MPLSLSPAHLGLEPEYTMCIDDYENENDGMLFQYRPRIRKK